MSLRLFILYSKIHYEYIALLGSTHLAGTSYVGAVGLRVPRVPGHTQNYANLGCSLLSTLHNINVLKYETYNYKEEIHKCFGLEETCVLC